MPSRSRARRLPSVAAAVLTAGLLGGCAYAEAGTLPEASRVPSAGGAAATPAGASVVSGSDEPLDARHGAADVAFVSAALVHHALSVRLAEVMRAETRAPAEALAVADALSADQGADLDTLARLLRLWGQPMPDSPALSLADLGADVERSTVRTRENLALLDGQRDSDGFTPFWVMTLQAHQDSLVERAERAARDGRSSTARAIAKGFVAEHRSVSTALAGLGG